MGELFTIRALATTLGVHPATVYRWRDAGQVRLVRLGRRTYRIERHEVERLLRAGLDDSSPAATTTSGPA